MTAKLSNPVYHNSCFTFYRGVDTEGPWSGSRWTYKTNRQGEDVTAIYM